MKIAYLISRYPALSHTFILREIQQLMALGWDLQIASINKPDRPFSELLPEEKLHAEQTYYVKKDGPLGALKAFAAEFFQNPVGLIKGFFTALKLGELHIRETLQFIFYYIEAVMVVQWMRRNQLTHLHVHFAGPGSSVGLLCKIVSQCQYSITVHGPDEFSAVDKSRLPEKFSAADMIICITDYAQSQVFLHADVKDWHKVRVVRVGLDCSPFIELANNKTQNKGPVKEILSIGRLVSAKGQVILLQAMADLKARKSPVHLTLIGCGPMEDLLREKAQQLGLLDTYITFAGGQNQDQVKEYLQKSDLFVLSSFAEGLPVVLMEALLTNIPCISTCIAGIPELIRHEKDGLLVPPGNPHELANAIQRCVEEPEFALTIASHGKKRVIEMHDIKRTTQKLSTCFMSLQQPKTSQASYTATFTPGLQSELAPRVEKPELVLH